MGTHRPASTAKPDSSLSGYSADREESSLTLPIVSIELSGTRRLRSVRELNSCPKRQKRSELQFAASSIKADLARAGIELARVNPSIQKTKVMGPAINLTGVRLQYSRRHQEAAELYKESATQGDYEALALACWHCYPTSAMQAKASRKQFGGSQISDRSTSSVSDTDSESGEVGNGLAVIPPLLESKFAEAKNEMHDPAPCRIIPSSLCTYTMGEMLTLTKVPRYEYGINLSCFDFSHGINLSCFDFSPTSPFHLIIELSSSREGLIQLYM